MLFSLSVFTEVVGKGEVQAVFINLRVLSGAASFLNTLAHTFIYFYD